MKTCTRCGVEQSPIEFSKDRWTADKLRKICKKCDRERQTVRRKKWPYGTELRTPAPEWLTEEQFAAMRAFYLEAERRTRETGVEHNVDHVIPLGSRMVCGLHVPWNLQVLTRDENSKKGAAF